VVPQGDPERSVWDVRSDLSDEESVIITDNERLTNE